MSYVSWDLFLKKGCPCLIHATTKPARNNDQIFLKSHLPLKKNVYQIDLHDQSYCEGQPKGFDISLSFHRNYSHSLLYLSQKKEKQ